jgi:hypothetical protein
VSRNQRSRRHSERASARPTWWVLLAVSMAVMALVFARSPGTIHRSDSGSLSNPMNDLHVGKSSNSSTPQIPVLAKASTPPDQASSTTTLPLQPSPSESQPGSFVQPGPTTAPVNRAVQSFAGYLSYPDNVVSSYPVSGGAGEVTAVASWTTVATLQLSISCPAGQRSISGTSIATVSMPVTAAPCTVALSEVTAHVGPVAYDITVTTRPDA